MRVMTAHAAQVIAAFDVTSGKNQAGGLVAHKAGV